MHRLLRKDTKMTMGNSSSKLGKSVKSNYLTRVEAAAYCRIPVSTFDELRRNYQAPQHDSQVGKHKLWLKSNLDNFLESGGSKGDWR